MPTPYNTSDKGYTSSDYGAGIGPGTSAGFGRRSTQNSSQTSMPSNPSPADSHGSKRTSMGPDKIKGKGSTKRAPKRVKPVKVGPKSKPKVK